MGLLTIVENQKVRSFQNLLDRVWTKVSKWKINFLLVARKDTLIKAVLQSIPTYNMGVFKIPKSIISKLNGLLNKFWWQHTESARKVQWFNWGN